VYAFIVDEMKKREPKRHQGIRLVISEWRKVSGSHKRPPSRELAAFVLERAMKGAWEVWGVKPPYSEGEVDSFYRRYVQGHKRALRDFRKALKEPQPWPPNHRGHWLKYFFGPRGKAAREFDLLTTEQTPWTVIGILEEDNPPPAR